VLTDMVERLKKEVDMLRSLKQQEENRSSTKSSWFTASPKKETINTTGSQDESATTRKFGTFGVAIVPSTPKQTITAHTMEGTCVKYDDSGPNLVATASSDSTVKVWDTLSGSLRGTFRGTPGHSIICCDIAGALVAGGGTDKTCRVWNLRTERMVRTASIGTKYCGMQPQ
jgi:WD40 repeat protein